MEAVKTGKTIIPALRGKEFFDYLEDDPEFAKLFNDAMTSISAAAETTIIAGNDSAPTRRLWMSAAGTAECWPPSWR